MLLDHLEDFPIDTIKLYDNDGERQQTIEMPVKYYLRTRSRSKIISEHRSK